MQTQIANIGNLPFWKTLEKQMCKSKGNSKMLEPKF